MRMPMQPACRPQNVNRSHACSFRSVCQVVAWPKPELFGLRREESRLPLASNTLFATAELVVFAT